MPNQTYEQRAERILRYLKADKRYNNGYLPRPFFVELTGSPSAGKTTTITELYKFFRRLGFRVLRPQEGAEVIQHIPRTTPVYNIRTGIYALTMLLDESYKHTYDLIILDRGIFDTYAWMMYWQDKGLLTPEECTLVQSFFLSRFWADQTDAAYFMVCEAQEAMRREMRIALSDRMGETTNPDSIVKLISRYTTAFRRLRHDHPQLQLMDTTGMDEQAMVSAVATETLSALERCIEQEKPA